MGDFEKLELSTETLRERTAEQMEQVAGGARPTLEGCRPVRLGLRHVDLPELGVLARGSPAPPSDSRSGVMDEGDDAPN